MRETRRDRGDKTGVKFAVGQVFQHKKVRTQDTGRQTAKLQGQGTHARLAVNGCLWHSGRDRLSMWQRAARQHPRQCIRLLHRSTCNKLPPHRVQFGYRGVVFGWDRSCERDAEWQRQMNIRDGSQPFYHCLPDEGDAIRLFGGGERPSRVLAPACSMTLPACTFFSLLCTCAREGGPRRQQVPAVLAVRVLVSQEGDASLAGDASWKQLRQVVHEGTDLLRPSPP